MEQDGEDPYGYSDLAHLSPASTGSSSASPQTFAEDSEQSPRPDNEIGMEVSNHLAGALRAI